MLGEMGMQVSDLDGDFDRMYVARLLEMTRDAGLKHLLVLAQEIVYDDQGNAQPERATSYVPNDYVLELARRHPEFLPAVSIHPARADALEELDKAIAAGARVMKCLPMCQNIDPARPLYRKFWERMAETGMVLLAHTGGERVLPVVRPELSRPAMLEVPLEIGVTVIAAHCGTVGGSRRGFFPEFVAMLDKYPRLYGDISGVCFPGKVRCARELVTRRLTGRVVHGSDFPVPVQPFWGWMAGAFSLRDYWRLRRMKNPLARDVAWKRLAGFPADVFTRIETLWR